MKKPTFGDRKKKLKLPYKNVAWSLGLKTKKGQELFFKIMRITEKYYDMGHPKIIEVLNASISHEVQMSMAGTILKFMSLYEKRVKEAKNKKK